jgi:hypothetical protein
MTHSPLTNGVQLTSDSSPRGRAIDRFIVHHAATTSLAAILALFAPGGRTVSANYALGNDGTLILAVDEDRRAWTSSSAEWDGRAVTIECANIVAGGSWPVSDATFDKLARLIADVAQRYGFPINDDTVLTHQELWLRYGDSYATACPGDLQRRKPELLGKAGYYRAFGSTAGGGTTPVPVHPSKRGSKTMTTFYARIDGNNKDSNDWTIAGVDLFEDEAANEEFATTRIMTHPGWWATDSVEVAKKWGRQFSFYPPETLAVRLGADAYVDQQEQAEAMHLAHVAGLRKALGL